MPSAPSLLGSSYSGNPFGTKPQPIAMPGSLYSSALSSVPSLGPLGAQTGSTIATELSGQLSPSTVRMLTDKAASYGVSSGMPGMTPGSLALNNLMASMGLTSEALQEKGVANYGNFLGAVGQLQLDPALQTDVGEWNSIVKSAPDPAAAAQYQTGLFDKYLAALKTPAGGTGSFAGSGSELPWYYQGSNFGASMGPGTWMTAPGLYHTPAPAGA
jgi:hypothetical protein